MEADRVEHRPRKCGVCSIQAANIACLALNRQQILVVIGLTGGIASGKSTAARHLASCGAHMIDADKLGHRVYEAGRPAFDQVVAAFGDDVVGEDGEINRRALGGKVFGSPDRLKQLTDIAWPGILAMAKEEIERARADGASVVVLEAAVLLEAKWQSEVDEVWVVTVDPEVAIARATARDGVEGAAVQARIDAQLSNAGRVALADVVIDNGGREVELLARLDAEWQRLGRSSLEAAS